MTWADGLTYTGEWRNGLRHGHGILLHRADLCQYKGDYSHDLPHGYGNITWLDGSFFEGQFEKGRLLKGSYTFASGNLYEGGFSTETGKFQGKGTFTSDIEITEAQWAEGKLNGQGVRKYATGEEYGGNWIDDHLEGHGHFQTQGGDKYRGMFQRSLEHGYGFRFYAKTKTEYVGEWQQGLHHGKGQRINQETGLTYSGNFFQNKRHGEGMEFYPGRYLKQGQWADDMLNGEAKTILYDETSGEVEIQYSGNFVNDKLNGPGTYQMSNGEKYTGMFRDYVKHGKGQLIVPSESNPLDLEKRFDVYEGIFEDGYMEGRGVVKFASGKVYEGQFKKGKMHGYGEESVIEDGQKKIVFQGRYPL